MSLSIYEIAKLAYADVVTWKRVLADLRKGHRSQFFNYREARFASWQAIAHPENVPSLREDLAARTSHMGQNGVAHNLGAFEAFCNDFLPLISAQDRMLMGDGATPVELFGHAVTGGAHFSVRDASGTTRYAYLHPSSWSKEMTDVFVDLLYETGKMRYEGLTPRGVWFLDLKEGRRYPFERPRKRILNRVQAVLMELEAMGISRRQPKSDYRAG